MSQKGPYHYVRPFIALFISRLRHCSQSDALAVPVLA